MTFKCFVGLALFCLTSYEGYASEIVGRTRHELDTGGNFEVCASSSTDGLESKSVDSDVILTGTVLEIFDEGGFKSDEGNDYLNPATARHNGTSVGRVKVWRVVKGSVNDVTRSRRRRRSTGKKAKRNPDEKVTLAGQDNPVLDIHGMRNNLLCGSFVNEGDTRVFFLKKMQDHRESRSRRRRSGKKKRNGRKRRNKKSKGMNAGSENKVGALRKSKGEGRSESSGTVWKRLLGVEKKKRKKSRDGKGKRPKRTKRIRSLLLMNNEPARITLKTLDSVVGFATQQNT